MASLKEVRARITSVSSTQQITKAMKMVAAAKLRRAQDNIIQMRPYANKLDQILKNVSATLEGGADNQYSVVSDSINKVLIIPVTSDRGLCGAFNTNIAKRVIAQIKEKYESCEVTILPIGKKGFDFFRKRGYNVIDTYANIYSNLSFDAVKEAAEFAMNGFISGDYDVVDLIYNEFKNVATQIIRCEQYLPVVSETATEEVESNQDYIFEPSKSVIVQELIPKSIKINLYKAVLESNASEHGARMTAMDKATDNAGELLKELKLTYNRSRQAAITTEILEIVGGAEALNN